MQRSVLALAGAQITLAAWEKGRVPLTDNDGVVTAQEVGGLDLQGTWIVALSGCDTGSGEARAGEGVLGLRRGFIQAGAKNLLMTLWPVGDAQTVQIIQDFYNQALRTGNAPQALADVQRNWLIKLRQESGLAMAVRLAGPFILTSGQRREGRPLFLHYQDFVGRAACRFRRQRSVALQRLEQGHHFSDCEACRLEAHLEKITQTPGDAGGDANRCGRRRGCNRQIESQTPLAQNPVAWDKSCRTSPVAAQRRAHAFRPRAAASKSKIGCAKGFFEFEDPDVARRVPSPEFPRLGECRIACRKEQVAGTAFPTGNVHCGT